MKTKFIIQRRVKENEEVWCDVYEYPDCSDEICLKYLQQYKKEWPTAIFRLIKQDIIETVIEQ